MGFLTVGGFYLYRTLRGNFERVFRCEQMSEGQRKFCFALGRFGCASRGVILLVIGYYLMVAGWNVDPRQVEGQAGALQIIGSQPLGPILLGIVALGLIALGFYSLAELRYGRNPRDKVLRAIQRKPTEEHARHHYAAKKTESYNAHVTHECLSGPKAQKSRAPEGSASPPPDATPTYAKSPTMAAPGKMKILVAAGCPGN
jgi:hypothetical protein